MRAPQQSRRRGADGPLVPGRGHPLFSSGKSAGRRRRQRKGTPRRRGASTLDYILVMGVILPLATIVIPAGMRIVRLVSELLTVLVAWPFS